MKSLEAGRMLDRIHRELLDWILERVRDLEFVMESLKGFFLKFLEGLLGDFLMESQYEYLN